MKRVLNNLIGNVRRRHHRCQCGSHWLYRLPQDCDGVDIERRPKEVRAGELQGHAGRLAVSDVPAL